MLNLLSDPGAGFGYDTNKVTLIARSGWKEERPLQSKNETAAAILDAIAREMQLDKQ